MATMEIYAGRALRRSEVFLLLCLPRLVFRKGMLLLFLSFYFSSLYKQTSKHLFDFPPVYKVQEKKEKKKKRLLLKGEHSGNRESVVKIRTRSVGLIGEMKHIF